MHAFEFGGIECQGLGAASLLESIAFSLPSAAQWNSATLRITIIFHDAEHDELRMTQNEQPHASSQAHVEFHRAWIERQLATSVEEGAELVEHRQQLLPNIDFCETALRQLFDLTRNHAMLHPVVKKLFELDRYARTWVEGPFAADQLPMTISGESQATLGQFSLERTFLCPDGQYRLFELHTKLTPFAWRLHFIPIPATRRILVGMLGRI